MSERYVCIHGHFYQPPRENPWLEAIEQQDSAHPYHDWNERITDECYAPNAASRILDGEGRIVRITNNYAQISFNVGPTLLAWLETAAPDTYARIIAADRESAERFGGHGSALAQAYNHMILPLALRRDKQTQIRWSIADFVHRFGRPPEGMWLPETAVDLESLDLLAAEGIRFTILAPHQAARVRRLSGGRGWRDVSGGGIDPTRAYQCRLPSGRTIALFFYDGPISRAVAFEHLLGSGESFARRLADAFHDARTWPQLAHIATDGETYGHHHRFGDMALAYALRHIESGGWARLTNYGEYLERHPPAHQVEIVEHSSWSCAHGVERWRGDCGCSTGGHPGWHQRWRAPLREALDWLRDELAPRYEAAAGPLLPDPWAARDDYIRVILDRSEENLEAFFARHDRADLAGENRSRALRLLELQRHAMLMYTSCGWFFDELSGIETVQVLRYAARALQLAQDLFADGSLEQPFLAALARAESNLPEHGDGRRIYEALVRPAMVDREEVGAHYAISSLFTPYPERARVYCFEVERQDYQLQEAGRARLAVGRARITSTITRRSDDLCFAVLHLGDHTLNGGVRPFQGEEPYQAMLGEMTEAFSRTDFPSIIRLMDRHFGESNYSLGSLFRDEQRKVLHRILETQLLEIERDYRHIYEQHAPLMHYLATLGAPLPRALAAAAEFVLNAELRRAFLDDAVEPARVRQLLAQVREYRVPLDTASLEFILRLHLERLAEALLAAPEDPAALERFAASVEVAAEMPVTVNLWKVQNLYDTLLQTAYPAARRRAEAGDEAAGAWADRFASLAGLLSVRVDGG